MNKDQMEFLLSQQPESRAVPAIVALEKLSNLDDRTLMFGYTSERKTFHVYLKDAVITKVIYAFVDDKDSSKWEKKTSLEGLLLEECIPDKRLYPAACDYEWCHLLKTRYGLNLPFTTYEERGELQFHGLTLDDAPAAAPRM